MVVFQGSGTLKANCVFTGFYMLHQYSTERIYETMHAERLSFAFALHLTLDTLIEGHGACEINSRAGKNRTGRYLLVVRVSPIYLTGLYEYEYSQHLFVSYHMIRTRCTRKKRAEK